MTSTPPPRRALRSLKAAEYNNDPLAAAVEASQKHDEIPYTPTKRRALSYSARVPPAKKPKGPKKLPSWGVDGAQAFEWQNRVFQEWYPIPAIHDGTNKGRNVKAHLFRAFPNEIKTKILRYVIYFDKPVRRHINLFYNPFSTVAPWTYHAPINRPLTACGASLGPRYQAAPIVAGDEKQQYNTMDYERDVLYIRYPRCNRGPEAEDEHRKAFQTIFHQIQSDPVACEKLQRIRIKFCPRQMNVNDLLEMIMYARDPNDMDISSDNEPLKALRNVTFEPHTHKYKRAWGKTMGEEYESEEAEARELLIGVADTVSTPFEVCCLDALGRDVKSKAELWEEECDREEAEAWRRSAMGPGEY